MFYIDVILLNIESMEINDMERGLYESISVLIIS